MIESPHEVLSREWLQELYVNQCMSLPEMEHKTGIDRYKILREIRRYGIYRGPERKGPKDYPDSFYLKRFLVEKKKVSVVANELGVTETSIIYQLKYRGIDYKSHANTNIFSNKQLNV